MLTSTSAPWPRSACATYRPRETSSTASLTAVLHTCTEADKFESWLVRIARNACIDHLRRNRLRFLSLDGGVGADGEEYEFQLPDSGPEPDTVLQRKEAMERLWEQRIEIDPDILKC